MTVELDLRSVRFPATGHIWIPLRGRRAAASGLSLHSACAPAKVLAQRALFIGVRAFGSRLIPGGRAIWRPPLDDSGWRLLLDAWQDAAGTFDSVVAYMRPQLGRLGFAALLLHRGRGVAFARLHPDAGRVDHEYSVLRQVFAARPASFRVARPIASGSVGAMSWLLTESVPNYPLGAVRNSRTRDLVTRELSEILLSAMTRPPGTPAHWVPAHGDFSPWNLRTELSRRVWIIDWEDAGFAPPGVDLLYGALTAHTTFGDRLPSSAPSEAIRWIDRRLSDRLQAEQNSQTANSELLCALRQISPRDQS